MNILDFCYLYLVESIERIPIEEYELKEIIERDFCIMTADAPDVYWVFDERMVNGNRPFFTDNGLVTSELDTEFLLEHNILPVGLMHFDKEKWQKQNTK